MSEFKNDAVLEFAITLLANEYDVNAIQLSSIMNRELNKAIELLQEV